MIAFLQKRVMYFIIKQFNNICVFLINKTENRVQLFKNENPK